MAYATNKMFDFVAVLFVTSFLTQSLAFPNNDPANNDEQWKGNWFPVAPGAPDTNPSIDDSQLLKLKDDKHGIKMGIPNNRCDDGKTNITLDWDGLPDAYTCYDSKSKYTPDINTNPISSCDHIPESYWALHACMNTTIEYDDIIPTFGTHRPLWARFGEYKYVPKQRWLHNLEHGSIVMLYHPCADKHQVKKLKKLVKKCLYRHVITPYAELSPDRPLALVSWGCRITMSMVDKDVVTSFIRSHALKGPERVYRDGQYSLELVAPAKFVTDEKDSKLCPDII